MYNEDFNNDILETSKENLEEINGDAVDVEIKDSDNIDNKFGDNVTENDQAVGVVVDCNLLNIRERPNVESPVIARLGLSSELKIDLKDSTDGWFSVSTKNGTSGYCMKKYVAIKQ